MMPTREQLASAAHKHFCVTPGEPTHDPDEIDFDKADEILEILALVDLTGRLDQWIKDHAYSPDDVVLGDQGLTDEQIPALHELLDVARPDWRSIFGGDS